MRDMKKLAELLADHGSFDESGGFTTKREDSPKGTYFEWPESFVEVAILNFCGCGRPESARGHVLDVLERFSKENNLWDYDETKDAAMFGTDGSMYFMFYWLSQEEYTEHGGSVPGWLTEKGIWLRDVLRLLKKEE